MKTRYPKTLLRSVAPLRGERSSATRRYAVGAYGASQEAPLRGASSRYALTIEQTLTIAGLVPAQEAT